jgi:hypothetical protein
MILSKAYNKKKENAILPSEMKDSIDQYPFHENPNFKNVRKAMQVGQSELAHCIENQQMVFFEGEPIDYGENKVVTDPIEEGQLRWFRLKYLILMKLGGIQDIRNAVDKIYENADY